jgi:hypothetical protein
MLRTTKIKALSLAKLQAVLMLFVGFAAGFIYAVGGTISDLLSIGLNLGTALAFLAIIGMPVMFAIFGYILGIIEALLFNLFSSWFRGIKIDLPNFLKNMITELN